MSDLDRVFGLVGRELRNWPDRGKDNGVLITTFGPEPHQNVRIQAVSIICASPPVYQWEIELEFDNKPQTYVSYQADTRDAVVARCLSDVLGEEYGALVPGETVLRHKVQRAGIRVFHCSTKIDGAEYVIVTLMGKDHRTYERMSLAENWEVLR